MSSGVGVAEDCLVQYQDLKLKKKFKYLIYKLNPTNTEIVVDKTSGSDDYDTFLGDLPENEPRWAVYDFEFEKEGRRNKLIFFSWCPDSAKIKAKMVFASSKDAFRRKFEGVQVEVQGTEYSEVSHEEVLEKAMRNTR